MVGLQRREKQMNGYGDTVNRRRSITHGENERKGGTKVGLEVGGRSLVL